MRKTVTKIICSAVAVISASVLAIAPACSVKWKGVSDKDTSSVVPYSNGGFVTETEDYVYFINGVTSNTDSNQFGKVLKGSIQRISRKDFDGANYANTQTVVPSVIYSGNYSAGLYIYNGYIYYTSPATEKNTDGEILNDNLDFKRTKLDGTGTETIWKSTNNSIDYRYVQVDNTVYIMYALSENLYGSSKTNIHSVNCTTKVNTMLAYGVSGYAFDTQNVENASAYFTMDVPQFLGESTVYSYNQLYKVRADATEPREIDFSEVEDYDAEKDPVYVNCGQFVFDGIGKLNYSDRLTQLNFTTDGEKYKDVLVNDDYSYSLKYYHNGKLYYTRKSNGSDLTNLYILKDEEVGENGIVYEGWDAITKNAEQYAFILGTDATTYYYYELGGDTYALRTASDGIYRYKVEGQKYDEKSAVLVSSDASATLLMLRTEHDHVNLYYSITGGNGYTFNRIAVDGTEADYKRLPEAIEPDVTYRSQEILDIDAYNNWYSPEFVGNKLLFASANLGQTNFHYITVCDLEGADGIMTNNELKAYNDKYKEVAKKYDKVREDDKQLLADAMKYYFYTGDKEYIDELVKAYMDILGEEEEYKYSKEDVGIFKDFANAEGDYAEYAEEGNTKTVNGKTVHANNKDYYYTVLGKMTDKDAESYRGYFRTSYMQDYPEDTRTWWEKRTTGEKVGFIIGMVACGLIVIGGATVLTLFLIKKFRKTEGGAVEKGVKVDITDDKSVNVYGDEQNDQE